jgi:hypothetical protein
MTGSRAPSLANTWNMRHRAALNKTQGWLPNDHSGSPPTTRPVSPLCPRGGRGANKSETAAHQHIGGGRFAILLSPESHGPVTPKAKPPFSNLDRSNPHCLGLRRSHSLRIRGPRHYPSDRDTWRERGALMGKS